MAHRDDRQLYCANCGDDMHATADCENGREVTRIDYSIAGMSLDLSKGQEFWEGEPVQAIAKFQAICQERNYPFTIIGWAWFSRFPAAR